MRKPRLLSLLTGTLLMTTTLFSLPSCALRPPSGEIVHAYLSKGAMNAGDSYAFSLTETEDGLRFSCSEDDGGGRVEFDDLPVPDALLSEFRRAAEGTGFADAVSAGKKVPKWKSRLVKDMTAWSFTLCWENGVERTSTVRVTGESEIRAFLSQAVRVLSVTEEDAGPLDELSLSASASWVEGCYSFSMTESKGVHAFSARFTDLHPNEDASRLVEERIDFEDAVLTDEQLERIRDAAREIGLWRQLAIRALRWEDPEQETMIPLDATTYSLWARWGTVSRSTGGWGDPDWGALMTVLCEIARDIAS